MTTPAVTVATFNVHWGLTHPQRAPFDVVAACRALDADVIVLQEAWRRDGTPGIAGDVGRELGYTAVTRSLGRGVWSRRPHLATSPHDATHGDWCLAVLSRLPVSGHDAVALPRLRFDPADRAVLRVGLVADGWPLTVAATHLPHLERGSPLLARSLRAALPAPDHAVALVGDMNMWGWCIDRMVPGWRRAVRGRTWPAARPHSQIDHVLVTASIEVVHAEVVPFVASDHRPVRVTLSPA